MSIKIKSKETLQYVGAYKGTYRYVMSAELYNRLSSEKVIQEAALRSGLSRGVMQAAWDAAGEVIKAWATEGHSVALPGLGSMRFGVRAKSVATVDEVAHGLITSRHIIFTPSTAIKDELAAASVQITCYDRNGKVVKTVQSDDDGTVDDDTTRGDTGSDSGTSDSGSGGSSGSGGTSGPDTTTTVTPGAGGTGDDGTIGSGE